MSTPSMTIAPVVGASSPAISPSSVDLPLPDGPVIATDAPPGIVEIERMQDRQHARAPLGTVLRNAAQLDHDAVPI